MFTKNLRFSRAFDELARTKMNLPTRTITEPVSIPSPVNLPVRSRLNGVAQGTTATGQPDSVSIVSFPTLTS